MNDSFIIGIFIYLGIFITIVSFVPSEISGVAHYGNTSGIEQQRETVGFVENVVNVFIKLFQIIQFLIFPITLTDEIPAFLRAIIQLVNTVCLSAVIIWFYNKLRGI